MWREGVGVGRRDVVQGVGHGVRGWAFSIRTWREGVGVGTRHARCAFGVETRHAGWALGIETPPGEVTWLPWDGHRA
jgi:hypothetical protein